MWSKMSSGAHDIPHDVRFKPNTYVTGQIVTVAIAVILILVIFLLSLHICACCLQQIYIGAFQRFRGLAARRRLHFGIDRDPAELLRIGLKQSVIESLPVFVYRSADHRKGLECAVCLCEFEEEEKARLLPNCKHSFHVECIDMWFDSHSTCPLCRSTARPDPPSTVVVVGGPSGTRPETDEESPEPRVELG